MVVERTRAPAPDKDNKPLHEVKASLHTFLGDLVDKKGKGITIPPVKNIFLGDISIPATSVNAIWLVNIDVDGSVGKIWEEAT